MKTIFNGFKRAIGGDRAWVWKSFCRGLNPIWMDPYGSRSVWESLPQNAEDIGRNLGDTLRYARRMDLAAMSPQSDLASTRFCLANPGKAYLVYLPEDGEATVDLSAARGTMAVEWMHPVDGKLTPGETVSGGETRIFKAPFDGDAVLYIRKE